MPTTPSSVKKIKVLRLPVETTPHSSHSADFPERPFSKSESIRLTKIHPIVITCATSNVPPVSRNGQALAIISAASMSSARTTEKPDIALSPPSSDTPSVLTMRDMPKGVPGSPRPLPDRQSIAATRPYGRHLLLWWQAGCRLCRR